MELIIKNRLVLACDVSGMRAAGETLSPAEKLIEELGGHVGWVKLNSSFISGQGELVRKVNRTGAKLWIDLKWNDVPDTLKNYVNEGTSALPGMLLFNVHATGGLKMMKAVKAKLDELFPGEKASQRPLCIAITVLTSMKEPDLEQIGVTCSVAEQVMRLARLAKEAGMDGVVASPLEAKMLRAEFGPDFLIVTPGIRFEEEGKGGQARVTTPKQAFIDGVDMIVMGTSLIKGGIKAVERAYSEIEEGLKIRAAIEEMAAEYHSLTTEDVLRIFGEMNAIYDNDHLVYTKDGHGKAYVNKDDIYVDPDQLSLLCKEIAFRVKDQGINAVCGPTVGGVLVANRTTEWLRRFTGDNSIIAIFADESPDGRILRRGYPKKVAGKRVLVAEDIINSGGSAAATVKAVQAAGGEAVCCFALCNRSADKKAAAELIGVPVDALLFVDMDNYPANECPYCLDCKPINQELGHGKQFLEKLAETDMEKAVSLGWKS